MFSNIGGEKVNVMGDDQVIIPSIEEWDKTTKQNFEHEALGLFVSDHQPPDVAAIFCTYGDDNAESHALASIEDPDLIVPF